MVCFVDLFAIEADHAVLASAQCTTDLLPVCYSDKRKVTPNCLGPFLEALQRLGRLRAGACERQVCGAG